MNILLTKQLSQEQLDLINSWGWRYKIEETLKIALVEVNEIPQDSDTWIISSRNSFQVVRKFIKEAPRDIYCIGEWIRKEIEKLSKDVDVKSFEHMKSLAAELSGSSFQKATYFCGREHRQELEDGLKNSRTKITKVITHESEMTFPAVDKSFEAIFLFSPRSAESLLRKNSFSTQTVFACIGSTTKGYLHGRGLTNTFVASHPDSNILLYEFYDYSRYSTHP